MSKPDFEHNSGSKSSGRAAQLAFVVGDPAETRPPDPRADAGHPLQPGADEDNKWLSDRLMACYND